MGTFARKCEDLEKYQPFSLLHVTKKQLSFTTFHNNKYRIVKIEKSPAPALYVESQILGRLLWQNSGIRRENLVPAEYFECEAKVVKQFAQRLKDAGNNQDKLLRWTTVKEGVKYVFSLSEEFASEPKTLRTAWTISPRTWENVLKVVLQVAQVLIQCQLFGVMHYNLSLDNVLVVEQDPNTLIKYEFIPPYLLTLKGVPYSVMITNWEEGLIIDENNIVVDNPLYQDDYVQKTAKQKQFVLNFDWYTFLQSLFSSFHPAQIVFANELKSISKFRGSSQITISLTDCQYPCHCVIPDSVGSCQKRELDPLPLATLLTPFEFLEKVAEKRDYKAFIEWQNPNEFIAETGPSRRETYETFLQSHDKELSTSISKLQDINTRLANLQEGNVQYEVLTKYAKFIEVKTSAYDSLASKIEAEKKQLSNISNVIDILIAKEPTDDEIKNTLVNDFQPVTSQKQYVNNLRVLKEEIQVHLSRHESDLKVYSDGLELFKQKLAASEGNKIGPQIDQLKKEAAQEEEKIQRLLLEIDDMKQQTFQVTEKLRLVQLYFQANWKISDAREKWEDQIEFKTQQEIEQREAERREATRKKREREAQEQKNEAKIKQAKEEFQRENQQAEAERQQYADVLKRAAQQEKEIQEKKRQLEREIGMRNEEEARRQSRREKEQMKQDQQRAEQRAAEQRAQARQKKEKAREAERQQQRNASSQRQYYQSSQSSRNQSSQSSRNQSSFFSGSSFSSSSSAQQSSRYIGMRPQEFCFLTNHSWGDFTSLSWDTFCSKQGATGTDSKIRLAEDFIHCMLLLAGKWDAREWLAFSEQDRLKKIPWRLVQVYRRLANGKFDSDSANAKFQSEDERKGIERLVIELFKWLSTLRKEPKYAHRSFMKQYLSK